MRYLKSFGAFWYDFIIGDDWHVAALVAAGLGLTALLVLVPVVALTVAACIFWLRSRDAAPEAARAVTR